MTSEDSTSSGKDSGSGHGSGTFHFPTYCTSKEEAVQMLPYILCLYKVSYLFQIANIYRIPYAIVFLLFPMILFNKQTWCHPNHYYPPFVNLVHAAVCPVPTFMFLQQDSSAHENTWIKVILN